MNEWCLTRFNSSKNDWNLLFGRLKSFTFQDLVMVWNVSGRWRCTLGHHLGIPGPPAPSDGCSQAGCPARSWNLWWPFRQPALWWRPWGYTHTRVGATKKKKVDVQSSLCNTGQYIGDYNTPATSVRIKGKLVRIWSQLIENQTWVLKV